MALLLWTTSHSSSWMKVTQESPLNHPWAMMADQLGIAHNCRGKNPLAQIMKVHYHPRKKAGVPVPRILGLTASPVLGSDIRQIEILENLMDARCKTPHVHRDELTRFVNRPVPIHLLYERTERPIESPTRQSLQRLFMLDILDNPFVQDLKLDESDTGQQRLAKFLTENTKSKNFIKSLVRRSDTLLQELGPWAADYFVAETIRAFKSQDAGELWMEEEHSYLLSILQKIDMPQCEDLVRYSIRNSISNKVEKLLRVLHLSSDHTVGIVFVQERTTTIVLEKLLCQVPILQPKFKVGSMTGLSRPAKGDVSDLLQPTRSIALGQFRAGEINLMIATSVLEEGIDVPECNLVICFDKPLNLKAFIQRRGRARMRESRLVIMGDEFSGKTEWQSLEAMMKAQYEDDRRQLEILMEAENSMEAELEPLVVKSTGATLLLDQAVAHLHHFCSRLSSRFVATKPIYIEQPVGESHTLYGTPLVAALVELPILLPQHLRFAKSSRAWTAKKNAFKDAAFQAYIGLYNAGLVNDHLLPCDRMSYDDDIEFREPFTMVRQRYNPWMDIARAWDQELEVFHYFMRFSSFKASEKAELVVSLPVQLPSIQTTNVYLAHAPGFAYELQRRVEHGGLGEEVGDHTTELLSLAFYHRWKVEEKQHMVRFYAPGQYMSLDQIGALPFNLNYNMNGATGLIRDPRMHPYCFKEVVDSKPDPEQIRSRDFVSDDALSHVPYVIVRRFPRHVEPNRYRKPCHSQRDAGPSTKSAAAISMPDCRVDSVPQVYAEVGLCMPVILRALEVALVAKQLSEKLLSSVGITDNRLVITAICASSAREKNNYQKLEFLGDTILKLITSVNCAAASEFFIRGLTIKDADKMVPLELYWPEGFLSQMKELFVSNSYLAKAAVDSGVDQFIITNALVLRKWRPVYVEDHRSASSPPKRRISTKMLADVVESLIGASHVDGGLAKALTCIKTLLPNPRMKWKSLTACRELLYKAVPDNFVLPRALEPLEEALLYTFRKKANLFQAVTHASCSSREWVGSLDRLEFIGDAVLDYIVVTHLFGYKEDLSLEKLHEMKTALVNAEILGFLCMEWSVDGDAAAVRQYKRRCLDEKANVNAAPKVLPVEAEKKHLWQFMLVGTNEIRRVQKAMEERYSKMKMSLQYAFQRGNRYPWRLLATLQIPKFYSDIVEAIIGAVWVDSGDFGAVTKVVERLGLLSIMRRILKDDVKTKHPKLELGILATSKQLRYDVWYLNEAGNVVRVEDSESSESNPEYETQWKIQDDSSDPVLVKEDDIEGDGRSIGGPSRGVSGNEYWCELFIGGISRLIVRGGVSREEVKIKAAMQAVLKWDLTWVANEGAAITAVE